MIIAAALLISISVFFLGTKGEGGFSLTGKRLYDLPDTDASDQGGKYKTDFDLFFMAAADEFGVPFALLKAEALKESSLNPRAFRDENPSQRTDRAGWASRGLMQLLFWPKSTRFEKYGFSSSRSPDDLYDPYTNIRIAAQLIRDNLNACGGNLRDAINMYNTGKKESQYAAPGGYVNKVISYYEEIIQRKVS